MTKLIVAFRNFAKAPKNVGNFPVRRHGDSERGQNAELPSLLLHSAQLKR